MLNFYPRCVCINVVRELCAFREDFKGRGRKPLLMFCHCSAGRLSWLTQSLSHTGIDSEGHAANFVETEQIVHYKGSKASFVQVKYCKEHGCIDSSVCAFKYGLYIRYANKTKQTELV